IQFDIQKSGDEALRLDGGAQSSINHCSYKLFVRNFDDVIAFLVQNGLVQFNDDGDRAVALVLIVSNQYFANGADRHATKFHRGARIEPQNRAIKKKNDFLSLGEPTCGTEKQNRSNAQRDCDANKNADGSRVCLFAHKIEITLTLSWL